MASTSNSVIAAVTSQIPLPSAVWLARARAHLDLLTKPQGSLGRLEDLAAQMVAIREERWAQPLNKSVYVFAADHGITAEGVSAYPREVTREMVLNFLAGGAAINVLATLQHVELHVVDVGVDTDFAGMPGLLDFKVRKGSRNMLHEAAMSDDEMRQALEAGIALANDAHVNGENMLAVGEMGIGNTTAASAIAAPLTGQPAAAVTGKGTGLDVSAREHKCRIVEAIVSRHFGDFSGRQRGAASHDPLEVLRCVGGLEIAAMTGIMLGAARHRIMVVCDGFISTAAAAIAFAVEPRVKGYLFAGHQSEEPGHRVLLEYIGLKPILTLDMRLGEGTGAVLAMPILESALCLYKEMATFASAGVSGANSVTADKA